MKADYDLKASKWGFLGGPDFTTTEEIANTEPCLDESDLQISFKKSTPLSIFAIFFATCFAGVLLVFLQFKFYYAAIVPVLMTGYFFGSRREQLRIDQVGIWSIKFGKYMPWKSIVDTYIESNHNGEETRRYLVTWYYNSDNKFVESHRVEITSLNSNYRKVAFSIEYNKMRHGKL